jgi:N-acetylglutamate synthase
MGRAMRDRRSSVQRYRDVFAQRDLVRELEDLAARAYPPLTVLELDGWRLRAARGFTWHANSVWPRAAGDRLGLERRLEASERFYRQRHLVPVVAVSPSAEPRGLDRSLAERGWKVAERRIVQTMTVDAYPISSERAAIVLTPRPPQRWLEAWSALAAEPDSRPSVEVLSRVAAPVAYAAAVEGGTVRGIARGVLDGGWLGVLDVSGGHDAALVASLARWAAEQGAERAYYEGAVPLPGFRTAYEYRYRALD